MFLSCMFSLSFLAHFLIHQLFLLFYFFINLLNKCFDLTYYVKGYARSRVIVWYLLVYKVIFICNLYSNRVRYRRFKYLHFGDEEN